MDGTMSVGILQLASVCVRVGVVVQCFCARTGSLVLRRNEKLLTDRVHYHSARPFPDGAPTVLHWPDRRKRTREQGRRRRDRKRAQETEGLK